MEDSVVLGNTGDALGSGGGLFNAGSLEAVRSVVTFNEANLGGGIYNARGLELEESTVSNNQARGVLPAVGRGGGIHNFSDGTVPAHVTLFGSTVSRNETFLEEEDGTIRRGVGFGGGIYSESGELVLWGSTVSFNFGGGNIPECCALSGAGIAALGDVVLINSTVAGNAAFPGPETDGDFSIESGRGGGILAGAVVVKNSILANNSGGNCIGYDLDNFRTRSRGHNLSDDATCADLFTETGDLNSTPAGLDPAGVKNNGGRTETIALLPTSPAVNAIPTSFCTDVNGSPIITTDQRGVPRPQGPACDIGAYGHFQTRFELFAVETYLLIEDVQSSPLPPGSKLGLTSPLEAAVASLNRGAIAPAINQLGAFVNHTGALVHRGTLTSEQASAFTSPAANIIQSLGGDPGDDRSQK
jgi:hypothetical protein